MKERKKTQIPHERECNPQLKSSILTKRKAEERMKKIEERDRRKKKKRTSKDS
jgi:hypothetical protein